MFQKDRCNIFVLHFVSFLKDLLVLSCTNVCTIKNYKGFLDQSRTLFTFYKVVSNIYLQ